METNVIEKDRETKTKLDRERDKRHTQREKPGEKTEETETTDK